jgi:hypothetical protein
MLKALATYIVTAMLSWSPVKDHTTRGESEAEVLARYDAIALDDATVALDPDETTLFPADPSKAETALLVASMGFWETRYWKHVDDGLCNDHTWRAEHKRPLECDGGQAWSLWQIHTGFATKRGWDHGLLLEGGEWRYDAAGYKGPELIADRKVAVRVALHMMRKSMRMSGTLCGYTGEAAPCPKARERLELATRYFREHPFAP